MITVVALGDSITAGQYVDPELAWPRLVTGYTMIPAGVNSDTTRLGLERFPSAVQQVKPDAVVIQFGHNDANRWQSDRDLPRVSALAYAANLQEMWSRANAFEVRPFFCTLTPTARSQRHAEDVALYNEILVDVAHATGSRLVDVRAAFEAKDGLLLDDGLHLSTAGHQLYASVVQEALDRLYR